MRRLVFLALVSVSAPAWAEATFTVKLLAPETALKAAQAALKKCRDGGYQAAVAVVDRMGVLQVLLRDRFAGPHTVDMASAKAYSAVSFRTNTSELAAATQAGHMQTKAACMLPESNVVKLHAPLPSAVTVPRSVAPS